MKLTSPQNRLLTEMEDRKPTGQIFDVLLGGAYGTSSQIKNSTRLSNSQTDRAIKQMVKNHVLFYAHNMRGQTVYSLDKPDVLRRKLREDEEDLGE